MSVLKRETFFLRKAIVRYALTILLFSACRFIFYAFNKAILPPPSVKNFLWGLWFDASAAAYVNAILWLTFSLPFGWRKKEWFRTIQKSIFVIFNFLVIIAELTDVAYFRYANRRTILSDITGLFANSMSVIPTLLFQYWYLVVVGFLLIYLLQLLYEKTDAPPTKEILNPFIQTALFIVSTGAFILAARGGWQLRPITPLSAAEVVTDMRLMPLVSNTTLNLIHSSGQRFIIEKKYMPDEEASVEYPIYHTPQSDKPFRPLNVVFIILESFGQEYSRYLNPHINDYQGLTPFFDSLARQSVYCSYSFANGLRSTQGIVAITTSLPALMPDPFMFSPYQSNRLDGLARHLKRKGYVNSFFHGSIPGSMDFDKLANLTGYDMFYDRFGYGNQDDFDGQWGIWDEPMLQFTAKKLGESSQPFFATFFSITSHHPFNVPKWFEEKYPDVEPMRRSFMYADYALQRFFETARQMSWFSNTLFVITADHTGPMSILPEYQTKVGRFKIPILIYKPNEYTPSVKPIVCQQADIVPTVLDILHYDQPYMAFGKSIFDTTDSKRYAFQFEDNAYQILDEQFVLFFNGKESIGFYDYQKDTYFKKDLSGEKPNDKIRLERVIKAVIQQHDKAMIYNRLTIQ